MSENNNIKRIMLVIAYDGTEYAGWQRQDNAVGIQAVIEDALRELLTGRSPQAAVCDGRDTGSAGQAADGARRSVVSGMGGAERPEVHGASRTDAGVHAYGNVAVFDTGSSIPAEKFAYALNSYLPEDIRILCSEEAEPSFHPRYADSEKTYQYHILNTDIPLPTMSRYAHHIYGHLNVDAMRAAASALIGEHDFTSFCAAGSQVKSKVRTIYEITIEETPIYGEYMTDQEWADGSDESSKKQENEYVTPDYDKNICIRITGNGFLYNMVRIIAGTLIDVGLGRRSVDSVAEALLARDRSKAGPTAPARGLFLEGITFFD
ncbi:MAG: tRNA pseudouridine(38-40) synthase TruA [Eubacterium sp.]|nr:tRNA pseudouridine(38-40) synthase TruA [Eubacterium sp.]